MDNPSEENLSRLEGMMLQDLRQALSEATGAPVEGLGRHSSAVSVFAPDADLQRMEGDMVYRHSALRRPSADPRYWRWLRLLSGVALKYTVTSKDAGRGVYVMACVDPTIAGLIGKVEAHPQVDCSNSSSAIEQLGLFNDASLPLGTILQRVIRDPGWCSARPQYEPYGLWLKRERMMGRRPGAQRFRFDNRHKDRVVFLFDVLYEAEHAFKRQHWLGAAVQQNPFDMYAITDIIHTVSPDLIIETGTANGGSALMWASMLELSTPGSGRVLTIDVNEPRFAENWGGKSAKDPTTHALWNKYVTFLKGSTLDPSILAEVRAAAAGASRVVVLLDSDHTEHHVELEAKAYCPLVSNGSYCIVQDTKLSRFSSVGGPMPGIRRFLASTSNFVVDREREPFYTQHVGGYLRRLDGAGGAGAAAGGAGRRLASGEQRARGGRRGGRRLRRSGRR